MSQTSIPGWVVIVLGGGGLVGASSLIFNVFKQVTDAKDAVISAKDTVIKKLEGDKTELKERYEGEIQRIKSTYENAISRLQQDKDCLKEELDELRNFRELLEENIAAIKAKGITEETNSNLRKIKHYLEQWQDDEELLESCRNAAHWVQRNQESWLQEISREAIAKYPDQVPADKQEQFRQDISEYLEWLYDSLYHGLLHEFRDYVDIPAIDSPFPYRFAFRYLRQKDDIGDLTAEETEFLRDYLDELIHFLQS